MKNNYTSDDPFSKVLTIGPSRRALGGIASVLNIYNDLLPDFKLLATNSPHGLVAGALAAIRTLVMMPVERMRGRSILHMHVASGKSFVRKCVMLGWGKFLGFKVIYHCHGANTRAFYKSVGIPKVGKVLSKCDAIVCLSKFWEQYFDSTFHHPNIRVVYNPLLPVGNLSRPALSGELKLLFLGRVDNTKGVFDMVEVFVHNRDRWKGRVKLTIGGSGEHEKLKNFISTNKLEDYVEFIGWVDGEKKDILFRESHVLILPSYMEGLPVSILEALSYGLPVISTFVGGIPEMVFPGENGILFKPGDKQAMSAAIDCYLLNPELIDRHGNGSLKQAPRFYPDKIKADLRKIYSSLLTK